MPISMQQTQAMLAQHHRDGDKFAQMMKQSFEGRFGESFWAQWQQWIEPIYSDQPVVLDLGTGPGMFLNALQQRTPGVHAIGVECAEYMLSAAVALQPGCEIITADLHNPNLPLADNSVDAALASVVLHEMTQPLRTLQELRRCLRPGGRFYIIDWVRAPLEVYLSGQLEQPDSPFDPNTSLQELDQLFAHFIEHNRFSREDLIFMLNRTGFAVLDSTISKEGRLCHLIAERR